MKLLTITFLLFSSFCLLGQTDKSVTVNIRDTKKIKAILQIFKEKRMQDSIAKAEKERALELEQNPYHFYYYDETAYDENGNLKYTSEDHIDFKINPTKVEFEFLKSWRVNVSSIDTLGTFIPFNYALIDTLYLINNVKFDKKLKLDSLLEDEFIEFFGKSFVYYLKNSLMMRHFNYTCDDLVLKDIVEGMFENKKLKKDLVSKQLKHIQICLYMHKNTKNINILVSVKKRFRQKYYYL
jgi:hypothetical protein